MAHDVSGSRHGVFAIQEGFRETKPIITGKGSFGMSQRLRKRILEATVTDIRGERMLQQ
jgi:hypothetical protein